MRSSRFREVVGSVMSLGWFAMAQLGCIRFAPDDVLPPSNQGDGATSGCVADEQRVTDDAWIDDFEDGDAQLLPNEGRNGIWFMTDDQSDGGVRSPSPTVEPLSVRHADGSTHAMHIWGRGFTREGVSLDVWFSEMKPLKSFDACRYKGIAFYGRAEGGTDGHLRLKVSSHGTEEGHGCAVCRDRYRVALLLTNTWAQFFVDFSELKQEGWGDPVEFDRSRLYGLEFATRQTAQFDMWIDDIRFY
jgi:hypothetical protein